MHIVISHHSLSGYGGTETYALTIGSELQHLGHRVWLYSATPTGPAAETARERGLAVTANCAELPSSCDALIAQDAGTAMSLAARFPDATRLYVAHSDFYPLQVPPQVEGFCDAIVVMSDRVKAFIEALAYHSQIVRLRQPVDLKRFGVFPPRAADGCRRALLLGNYLRGREADVVAAACRAAGFELSTVGAHTQSTSAPEREIAGVDVVIGYGRCVVEALASRCAAYVYGLNGGDGWVTPDTYDALEADGFGGRGLKVTVSPDRLASDLAQWDSGMGEVNRRLAAQHHDAIQHATSLTALIKSLGRPRRAALTSAEELARLVRIEWESWGRYLGALEELRRLSGEIERQRAEIAELKTVAHSAVTKSTAEVERLRFEITQLEAERAAEIAELKTVAHSAVTKSTAEVEGLRFEITQLEAERAAEIAELKTAAHSAVTKSTAEVEGLRFEITRLEAERAAEIAELKTAAHSAVTKSTAEVERLRFEITRLEAERAALRASLSEIRNSRSWRVTRPLRRLRRRLKALQPPARNGSIS